MRRRSIAIGILILLLSFGIKLLSSPTQYPALEEDDVVVKKKKAENRLPASTNQKTVKLRNKPKGSQYTVSDRTPGADHQFEDELLKIENTPEMEIAWNEVMQAGTRKPSSMESSKSQTKAKTDANKISTSTFYTGPQLSQPGGGKKTSDPKVPVCSVGVTGGSFQGPVEIELTCSTTSSIKYCISENICCDPEQGIVYTSAFQLGQASKSLCLSFAGTSFEDQITSETKEAFYNFDPELPHLEVIQNKTHIQTTQLDDSIILKSNDFGSNHHAMGVINLKSHDPSPSALNMNCTDIVSNHPSLTYPTPYYILTEMNVSTFSPASQMNLFLTENVLTYGENNLAVYMKSILYSYPQYSCSTSKLNLEDFNYVQTLPVNITIGNDNAELYGGFTSLSTIETDPGLYRGPARELGDAPTQELRTGLISIFFDK